MVGEFRGADVCPLGMYGKDEVMSDDFCWCFWIVWSHGIMQLVLGAFD
jgi:hypothetical protein